MITIFAYHSINKSDYRYAVSPENFERQLKYIKSRFEIIGLKKLKEILKNNILPGKDVAVVTFDDGLRDNYVNAFPILKKMNIPVALFLATGLVGKTLKTDSGDMPMLTWPEIQEMHQSGLVDFQSHTNNHIDITATEIPVIRKELIESKQLLTEMLGKSVDFFAYPKGRMNKNVELIVGEYFSLAFAGNGLINDFQHINRLALPRVTVRNNFGLGRFKLMTSPLYWKLKLLKNKLIN